MDARKTYSNYCSSPKRTSSWFFTYYYYPPWYDGDHLTEDEINAFLGKQEFQERIESRFKEVISQEILDKESVPQISITKGVKHTLEYVFFFFSCL